MRVLITAVQFSSSISGLQRHALSLIDCLLQQPQIAEVHFVLAPWQRHLIDSSAQISKGRVVTHIAEMTMGFLSRNIWYYRYLPRLVELVQPDIVHLSYPVPLNRTRMRRPVIVTLHDLYPYDIPENFGFPKAYFNRAILQQCLRSADAIACVSDTTLSRMRSYVHRRTWEKAIRIYNCVEAGAECTDSSPVPEWNGEPFLLSVSQHRKNKNISLLIEAFHRLLERKMIHSCTRLVVVGIPGPETGSIQQLVAELGLHHHIVFLHGLSDPALQWCYRHCELLAAPSSIEGFGLPVAEALLAGCRIVCSDIPAFREIDTQHCTFVSPGANGAEGLVAAIASALGKPRPAPITLPQFSSQLLGAQYLELYRRLLSSSYFARDFDCDSAPVSLQEKCFYPQATGPLPDNTGK